MKKTYEAPIVDVLDFTVDETICTDMSNMTPGENGDGAGDLVI